MRFRLKDRAGFALIAAVAAALLSAPSAAAATDVGNGCQGAFLRTEHRTFVSLANAGGDPLRAAIPESGVITGWSSQVSAAAEAFARVKVVRHVNQSTGEEARFRVVAQSEPERLQAGGNRFPTRIPVEAGDLIGLSGDVPGHPIAVPLCEAPGARLLALEGDPPLGGETNETIELTDFQVPLIAVVEPDADHDGFGDETQDRCPQSFSTQGACPTSLFVRARAGRKSALVFVSTSSPATVGVDGAVKLKRGRRPLRVRAQAQSVAAGASVRFVLWFPPKLRARLKRLRPKHSLPLRITASATTGAGEVTTGILSVRLTGRPGH